ncbi:hypothetical protein D9611_012208 [Ephemerocybe angulata]|uniref:Uncharacterized protein n=1 Tax=Ephemerocybe angulata TaxID=980116 RepID=A0A8H5FFR2_9AGAR|nr:hypothetical protein D9611_012208 [Tulosesus angulatus]
MASNSDSEGESPSSKRWKWLGGERRVAGGSHWRKPSLGDTKAPESSSNVADQLKAQKAHFLKLFGCRAELSPRSSHESLKRKDTLPLLPPELWIYIFHLATSPSHPFLSSSIVTPSTPISFMEYPSSHSHLIPQYNAAMAFKCSLTHVCRLWHVLMQEVLFEFVWITKGEDASRIVKLLDAHAVRKLENATTTTKDTSDPTPSEKAKGKRRALSISAGPIPVSDDTNLDYDNKGAFTYPFDTRSVGRHIRRIHIETPPRELCSPQDIIRLVELSPGLVIFSDFQSIRRNPNFHIFSTPSPESASNDSSPSPTPSTSTHIVSLRDSDCRQAADHRVLSALLDPPHRDTGLRRLSWTNYDYENGDYEAGMRYYLRVFGPKIERAQDRLEFLELTLSKSSVGGSFFDTFLNAPPTINPHTLTTLNTSLSSTTVTTSTSTSTSSLSPSLSDKPSTSTLDLLAAAPLHLPALRSLKVTLDNVTFAVLASWDMPVLQNLSVISADFSYAGDGFAQFFISHGEKIVQLELGHSSGEVEEFWLAGGPGAAPGANDGTNLPAIATWLPNLKQLIVSADAEWDWQNPNVIAPHVLIPSHPTLDFIGIRDLQRRIYEGLERVEARDADRLARGGKPDALPPPDAPPVEGFDPWFALIAQFSGLAQREAFPKLKYIRDLSWESGAMRNDGKVRVSDERLGRAVLEETRRKEWDLGDDLGEGEGMVVGEDVGGVGDAGHASGSANGRRREGPRMARMISSFVRSASSAGALSAEKPSVHATLHAPRKDPRIERRRQERRREAEEQLLRAREIQQWRRAGSLWIRVVKMCKDNKVWLEDCAGVNITFGSLWRVEQEVKV